MDPLSNVDRLVLLLRQRLQERDRTRKTPGASVRSKTLPPPGPTAAQALAAMDGVDDRQFRRAVIQGLLTDQLGPAILNDASFQQVVDRVVGAIEGDDQGRLLLDRIASEMKALAR